MQMWRLLADFWTDLEKGLQHLPQDIKQSTSPILPLQISVNPIRITYGSLSRTKLNKMEELTQGTHVPQVKAILHRTRPFKKIPTRTRMGYQIHHNIMGPFTSNIKTGSAYCGLKLDWDYANVIFYLSMSG
jgi:hypothetical protein